MDSLIFLGDLAVPSCGSSADRLPEYCLPPDDWEAKPQKISEVHVGASAQLPCELVHDTSTHAWLADRGGTDVSDRADRRRDEHAVCALRSVPIREHHMRGCGLMWSVTGGRSRLSDKAVCSSLRWRRLEGKNRAEE